MLGVTIVLPWKREKLSEIWNWPGIFWINVFGWWAEYASTPFKRRFLRWIRVMAISYCIIGFFLLIHGVIHKLSIEFVMHDLYKFFNFTITALGTFKALQLVKNRKIFRRAMDTLDELTRGTTEPQDEATIRASLKTVWIVFAVDLSAGLYLLIAWCARPIVIVLLHGQKTQTIDIVWPVYVIETWGQFVFTFISQTICNTLFACGFYMFDNFFFSLSEYILCHMTVLKNNLERLHLKGHVDDDIQLKKIINRHNNLLQICKDLNIASQSVFLVQLVATVSMICVGLFFVTKVEVTSVVIQSVAQVTLLATGLLFVYCWYSNEITIQCENVRTWAYLSSWMEGSERQKKTLLILMIKATQPVTFGGFLKINLNTFINVLKTTFSYYNFLTELVGTGI